jgi:Electron transfer DM13
MKKIYYYALLLLTLISCEETGPLTTDGFQAVSLNQGAILKYKGDFYPTSGINVTGGFEIYLDNNHYVLKLKNFNITSGPDLKVYLSKSDTPNDFINLGNLNNLTQFAIPDNTNFMDYKFVLIHCQAFNHLFAVSKIIKI